MIINKRNSFTVLMILLLLFSNLIYGQVKFDTPRLIQRYKISGSSTHSMSEFGYEIASAFKENADVRLILRLCSTKSLQIAIGTAAVDPVGMMEFFDKSAEFKIITAKKTFLELSNKCVELNSISTATELLIVPSDYIKINQDNLVELSRIKLVEYRSSKDALCKVGTSKYKPAFFQMVKDIKSDKISFGLVLGYKDRNGLYKSLKRRLKWASRHLRMSGFAKDRVFINEIGWNRGDEGGEFHDAVILGVKISKNTKEDSPVREIIFVK